ncbi:MAG: YraN family protein [Patescibacteria group bacterium]
MDDRRELGNLGEGMALDFLTELGYQILERQWRCVFGEVDLICLDPASGEVVFVEVKTRQSLESGYPEDAVTPKKRKSLEAVGEWFLRQSAWEAKPYRFDVVAIILNDFAKPEITHLQGI